MMFAKNDKESENSQKNKYSSCRIFIHKLIIQKSLRGGIRFLKRLDNEESRAILDYLKENEYALFNYKWAKNYIPQEDYAVQADENGRLFVNYNSHRMYFKKSWAEEQIKDYMNGLCLEQDERSPHCYFLKGEKKDHYETVVDAGAAEGIFTLDIIDRADKVYLIEYDREWLEALELTLKPFADKVVVVPKFLGDTEDEQNCTLLSILQEVQEIDFLKMDIEGSETSALGVCGYDINKIREMRVCVYHNQDDEKVIRSIIENYGEDYVVENRSGYMFFYLNGRGQKYPYFRRGVLKIKKCRDISLKDRD